MNWKNLILLVAIGQLFNSCVKTWNTSKETGKSDFVIEARKFFDTSTETGKSLPVGYKSRHLKMVLWDDSKVTQGKDGFILVAPIGIPSTLICKDGIQRKRYFQS